MSISSAPATLGLTTPHQIARSDWTNDFLAPRSCWAPIVQTSSPHLPQEVPMLPGMVPKPQPCTTSRVWSIVGSMAILSHNSAAFMRGPALGWLQISREDGNARCGPDWPSRASEQHPPWLSPNPATRAPFSDWPRELVSCSPIQKTFRRLVLLWPRLRSLRIG